LKINSSLIRQIDIIKNDVTGRGYTRIIIKLTRHAEFSAVTDASSKNRLLLTVVEKKQSSSQAVFDEKKAEPVQPAVLLPTNQLRERLAPAISENKSKPSMAANFEYSSQISKNTPSFDTFTITGKSLPLPVFSGSNAAISGRSGSQLSAKEVLTIEGLNITESGIELNVNGIIENFKFFKLVKPQRLVIDIFDVKTALLNKLISINKFGINRVRLGIYSDKVRVVLDSSRMVFPASRIEVSSHGLKVLFVNNQIKEAISTGH
jgi:type IV pilus assembly protein PilQ